MEDEKIICAHPHFKTLESFLTVEFRTIKCEENPYTLMTACHCDAIKQGKRLVAICSIHTSMEKMKPHLPPFNYSSQALAKIAIPILKSASLKRGKHWKGLAKSTSIWTKTMFLSVLFTSTLCFFGRVIKQSFLLSQQMALTF
ncbi:hypothetical protein [Candidatus Neptunichlamydia sp. REUL1]|uniref:hypothetical protein n=1 Tax=Candidatus Neptunichlamydia sp. REUL1 TaxID=3064277 RepID=UPI00292F5FED|nr:hypothetical protein [Candidatus Neptunochlamydia sp. REUL1]